MPVSDSAQSEHGLHAGEEVGGNTAVLHTGGLQFASEKAVLEKALGARPGVLSVEANPVAQTATVRYDPRQANVAELRKWVEECGLVLRPEIAAISMSGSSVIVAVNALLLKRLRLPEPAEP